MIKTYNIFIKQNKTSNAVDDILFIKDGFNAFAFLFNIFWFLSVKLWLFAFLFFAIITFANIIFSPLVSSIFSFMLSLLVGFEANNLLLYRFQRDGYYFVGYSFGNNKKEAEIKYLEEINKNAKDSGAIVY